VNFAGDVPQIDLPNLYRQAKIFVLNSNFEATSYSLLEARSCGLPSLARGGTGSDEVIHSGVDGILCDGANSQSLEEGLRALLANPVEADNYAKKGRQSILKSFDVETNYQKILDVISG
jgi:glycosyltransferase involved in cell wall biosynthesis